MNAPAALTADALSLAADERAQAVIDRQLALLGRLAEAGLEVALAVEREAKAVEPGSGADVAALAMAYARAARAVRLTVMLQSKVLRDRQTLEQDAAERTARLQPREMHKARVERIVERVAKAACGEDEDQVDRLVIEAGERLDDEDLYGEVLDRPVGELVALICRDLGLDPDWPRLAEEAWAQAEIAGGAGWPWAGRMATSPSLSPATEPWRIHPPD